MAERDGKPPSTDPEASALAPGDLDPLAPPTAEELAASQRLRDALEDPSLPSDEADLARALRAAWAPGALPPDELEVPDDDAGVSASALAEALDGAAPRTPEAELGLALRAAWAPRPLPDAEHRALVQQAVGAPERRERHAPAHDHGPRRGVVVRVAFGVSVAALALAASVLLFVTTRDGEVGAAPLARARSTQPLFAEPFRPGEASARIDRIALARASDLRHNRFSHWGVK